MTLRIVPVRSDQIEAAKDIIRAGAFPDGLIGDFDTPAGIVKLSLTAVSGAQHGGFATGWGPVSWG